MFRILLAVSVIVCAFATPAPKTIVEGITRVYDSEAKIESDGFVSETHHVVTTDGYILEINRIPNGRTEETSEAPKPVVFLMHGLQASAASYITIGPEHSTAYNLADAGFDVWMGNARGVLNSRNHISLNPDDDNDKKTFFDFTFEEIATIDVPTMIDYVLEVTGQEKLHYIGHSQGGTVFLILTSMLPAYNEKFESVHLLAGVGYQNHFPDTSVSVLAMTTDIIYAIATSQGMVELFGPSWNDLDSCDENCELNAIIDIMQQETASDVIAGCALKQFAHYGQNIRDKKFRRWNYGLLNFINYGSFTPPDYNLSLITADVTMHYSVADNLLGEEDVLAMAADMPNTTVRKISRDTFTHMDFTVAQDAKELVTDYIIEAIKNRN